MGPDKLTPNDPRVSRETFTTNGKTYHYILANPSSPPRATILLVHGWPDLAFGWRYQVPYLVSLGLRVIVPDQLGYGQTSAPQDLASYSHKSTATDMIRLADHVLGSDKETIILGGHDWGGALVWRMALWFPERVRAVFSVCTPYSPPSRKYLSPEQVAELVPNFTYQLQFITPEPQERIQGERAVRQFFNGIFGGQTPEGERILDVNKGLVFERLEKVGPAPLLTPEELEVYVRAYTPNGLRGPFNWYRTRKVNYEEELELIEKGRGKIAVPSLFVLATKDSALPPWMSMGMEEHFETLERAEVEASHWALVEKPDEVNAAIGKWLGGVLGSGSPKSSL